MENREYNMYNNYSKNIFSDKGCFCSKIFLSYELIRLNFYLLNYMFY